MNKTIVIYFLLFTAITFAQPSFLFIPDSLVKVRPLGNEIVFEIPITNISMQTITISVIRRTNTLPHTMWQSSLCFDENCFAPDIDSVATTADFLSSPILPGQTRDFSLHVFPLSAEGYATVIMTARNENKPSDSLRLAFIASTYPLHNDQEKVVQQFKLNPCFPNPFNPSTKISYDVAEKSEVTITVHTVAGEEVATLFNGIADAGSHTVLLNAADYHLTSGMYFIRMQSGENVQMQKVVLLK